MSRRKDLPKNQTDRITFIVGSGTVRLSARGFSATVPYTGKKIFSSEGRAAVIKLFDAIHEKISRSKNDEIRRKEAMTCLREWKLGLDTLLDESDYAVALAADPDDCNQLQLFDQPAHIPIVLE